MTTAGEEETSSALFGSYDILVLAVAIAVGAYWLLFRKKNVQDSTVSSSNGTPFSMVPMQNGNGTIHSSSEEEQGFISKMKAAGRTVVVFYGSQTGTAEEFATRLAKEASKFGMKGMVADPEECEMEELMRLKEIPNSLAILCMATYGEGDFTDNAQTFQQWLEGCSDQLDGLNYTVFGLGNKTYEHYNAVGKYVDKRLEELGATRVFQMGLGDDDANLEDDFVTWKEQLWPSVCATFGIEAKGIDVHTREYNLTVHENLADDKIYKGEINRLNAYKNQKPPYDAKNPYLSPVRANRELNKSVERSCMHIEFDIKDSRIRYDTGDHVAVYPSNNPELVDKLGKLLNTDLDTIITLTSVDADSHKKHPFPCPTTYRTALLYYLDITSIPRTHIMAELAEHATDPEEQQMLKLMASPTPEGKSKYNEWVVQSTRNLVHILEDLPSCKPAMDHVCEILPRLQARYYSISSSPKLHPDHIHVTAVLVEYTTPTQRLNKGVATSWLAGKHPDNGHSPTVPVYVRRSQFRLPPKPQTPVVMVGPGTGLAPFRGFIQERAWLKQQGKPLGETVLFFGCRKKSQDFIYQEELEGYVQDGTLKMHVAFSRDQQQKVYVTHLLREQGAEVWKLIGEQNGYFYVCGDAKNMARDVHNIMRDLCIEHGKMTEAEANTYIKKMESQKRYSSDVWS